MENRYTKMVENNSKILRFKYNITFRFLLVRIFNLTPFFARLWRILNSVKLARGEKNKGCGQNVLTSKQHFLDPVLSKILGKKIIALALVLYCFLVSSCDIVNPEEALPAYLKIERFEFSTTPAQGTASEQITDVWVFVNDLSLGIYELPATIPSLDVGNQNITIFPVIRENGVRSTPIIYPFYNRFETNIIQPIRLQLMSFKSLAYF